MESSVYSFEETLRRLLERIERTEELLRRGSGLVDEEQTDFDDDEVGLQLSGIACSGIKAVVNDLVLRNHR